MAAQLCLVDREFWGTRAEPDVQWFPATPDGMRHALAGFECAAEGVRALFRRAKTPADAVQLHLVGTSVLLDMKDTTVKDSRIKLRSELQLRAQVH